MIPVRAGAKRLLKPSVGGSRQVSAVASSTSTDDAPSAIIPLAVQHVRHTFFPHLLTSSEASCVPRMVDMASIISRETLQRYKAAPAKQETVTLGAVTLKQLVRDNKVSECLQVLNDDPQSLLNFLESFSERDVSWFIHVCCEHINRLSGLQRGREFLNDAGENARHAETILYSKKLEDMSRFDFVLKAVKNSGKHEMQVADYEQILQMQTYSGEMKTAVATLKEFESISRKLINKERTTPLYFTTAIWNCKFQILADGLPELWKVQGKKIMRNRARELPPNYRYLHHDKSVRTLLKMFQSEKITPDRDTLKIIVLCFGRSGDLERLKSFISKMWGINGDGSVNKKFLRQDSSLFRPTPALLSAIISAFAIQNEYLQGMQYVDSFVSTYNMDMSRSEQFWSTAFRFLELVVKGKLKYHSAEQRPDISSLSVNQRRTYKAQTYKLPDSLWELCNTHMRPTAKLYMWRVRYLFYTYRISELKKVLVPLYELAKSHQIYNSRKKVAYETSELLYICLVASVRLLIGRGYETQARNIIEDLALNREMKERLDRTFEYRKSQQMQYLRRQIEKRTKKMDEEDDDEDGLFSWI